MVKSSSKLLLAGLAGLAVGAAVGVLIAPSKGSKTRKRLKKNIRELQQNFKEGNISDKLDKLKSVFIKDKEDKVENEPPSENKDQTNA